MYQAALAAMAGGGMSSSTSDSSAFMAGGASGNYNAGISFGKKSTAEAVGASVEKIALIIAAAVVLYVITRGR